MSKAERVINDLNVAKHVLCNPQMLTFEMNIRIGQAITSAVDLLKEQEAKRGEWIDIWREDDPDTSSHARCSVCNRVSARPVGAYCKWCGAKMDSEGR